VTRAAQNRARRHPILVQSREAAPRNQCQQAQRGHDQECRAADVRIKQAGGERHQCNREANAQCAIDCLCRRRQADWRDRHQ
jgi:hypothetical protein